MWKERQCFAQEQTTYRKKKSFLWKNSYNKMETIFHTWIGLTRVFRFFFMVCVYSASTNFQCSIISKAQEVIIYAMIIRKHKLDVTKNVLSAKLTHHILYQVNIKKCFAKMQSLCNLEMYVSKQAGYHECYNFHNLLRCYQIINGCITQKFLFSF